jgi:sulfur carrier protein
MTSNPWNLIRIIPAKGSGSFKDTNRIFNQNKPPTRIRQGRRLFDFKESIMQIMVNGKQEHSDACSIEQMVLRKGLKPEALVVEYNHMVIPQEQWARIALKEGDKVELLSFVGGG